MQAWDGAVSPGRSLVRSRNCPPLNPAGERVGVRGVENFLLYPGKELGPLPVAPVPSPTRRGPGGEAPSTKSPPPQGGGGPGGGELPLRKPPRTVRTSTVPL